MLSVLRLLAYWRKNIFTLAQWPKYGVGDKHVPSNASEVSILTLF